MLVFKAKQSGFGKRRSNFSLDRGKDTDGVEEVIQADGLRADEISQIMIRTFEFNMFKSLFLQRLLHILLVLI